MLFAVIGAKLSEGLNFADDLARCVAVVGLPFANLGSVELQERMKYVRRLEEKGAIKKAAGQKDAAAELYENMCMNAVNQSIGGCNRRLLLICRIHVIQDALLDIRATGRRWCYWTNGTRRVR